VHRIGTKAYIQESIYSGGLQSTASISSSKLVSELIESKKEDIKLMVVNNLDKIFQRIKNKNMQRGNQKKF